MGENINKLRVGWFTFTCCEDSTIIFTELFNTHYQSWMKKIDFVHAKVLKSQNKLTDMDVAFVEGAITSDVQEEKLKKIRNLCKKLIAIGSCACTGSPSTQRNTFPDSVKEEIKPYLDRFMYGDRVKKLDECVTVDDRVHGCPMTEAQFLQVLNKYLKEFGVS